MTQVLAFINTHPLGVSACTVVLVFVLRLLSRSGYPEFLPFLPAWADLTTWGKWGWPGRIGQGVVTCLLSGGVVLAAGLEDMVLTDAELQAAGEACLGAFGLWHGLKKLAPGKGAKKAPITLPSVTLLLMALPGCGLLQSAPVQSGLAAAEAVCTNTLLRSPDVQRMLIQSGVVPESVATVIESACAVLAATKPGLESLLEQADKARAPRDRVLSAEARSRGLLP